MKTATLFFMMLLLASLPCRAEEAESPYPPGYVSIKGAEFLAMHTAYEAFRNDQKKADITKLKISLFVEEDGSVAILFSHPPKYHYAPDGKLLALELNADAGKYGADVTYYVDPKTNKIIKRQYERQ